MSILICASDTQFSEIAEDSLALTNDLYRIHSLKGFRTSSGFDAFFFLNVAYEDIHRIDFNDQPVFLNEVARTSEELSLPKNFFRLNAWPGFLSRGLWEVAGAVDERAKKAAAILGRQLVFVGDVPGLVSATVICNIILEARIALKEGLSTREEIDKAMKLGTNYPLGPFEWERQIGAENVEQLLERLGRHE